MSLVGEARLANCFDRVWQIKWTSHLKAELSGAAHIDDRSIEHVLNVRCIIFLDYLDAGVTVFGDLINVGSLHKSETGIGMPQAVASADVAMTVEFQIQFIEDGVHQLARRLLEYLVGRF